MGLFGNKSPDVGDILSDVLDATGIEIIADGSGIRITRETEATQAGTQTLVDTRPTETKQADQFKNLLLAGAAIAVVVLVATKL